MNQILDLLMFDIFGIAHVACTRETAPHKHVKIQNIRVYVYNKNTVTCYIVPFNNYIIGCYYMKK